MKKKYIRKFIALFDMLPEAAGILSGKYDDNREEKEALCQKVNTANLRILEIIDDPENKFLKKVFDEIDDNLYQFHSCCNNYIKDLLSGFIGIAPFLVFSPHLESINFDDESCPDELRDYASLFIATLSLIAGTESSPRRQEELSAAENYILSCSGILQFFAGSLDARCLRFEMDLFVIQEELNIFILSNRDLEALAVSGYMDTVRQLVSKNKTARQALPEAQSPLSLMQQNPGSNTDIEIQDQNNSLTLESVFADPFKFNFIMQLLVDRKLCQSDTFIWIDLKKGYKTHIVSILKYLFFQNYYKSRTGLTNEEIQQIALNTFGVQISIDTIKHAEISNYKLNFIPEASKTEGKSLKIAAGSRKPV